MCGKESSVLLEQDKFWVAWGDGRRMEEIFVNGMQPT
jgi:hypothetical protein